jgi:hypothetical protein
MQRITVSFAWLQHLGESDILPTNLVTSSETELAETNRRALKTSPEPLIISLAALPSIADSNQKISRNESQIGNSQVLLESSTLRSVSRKKSDKSVFVNKNNSRNLRNQLALEDNQNRYCILKKKLELMAQARFLTSDDPRFLEQYKICKLPESLAGFIPKPRNGLRIRTLRKTAYNPSGRVNQELPSQQISLNACRGDRLRADKSRKLEGADRISACSIRVAKQISIIQGASKPALSAPKLCMMTDSLPIPARPTRVPASTVTSSRSL